MVRVRIVVLVLLSAACGATPAPRATDAGGSADASDAHAANDAAASRDAGASSPRPIPGPDQCFGVDDAACAALRALALPSDLPPARGNAHADDMNAVLFGFHVFFDSRFSRDAKVRCESCHSVDYAFTDAKPTPTEGLGDGRRNSPTIFNAARYDTFFWDGRADSLWSQPLFAFENPSEMDFTRLEIVHNLVQLYPDEYEAAFGPLPDLSDLTRFPARGAPGAAAFDEMAAADRATVNLIVANLGKALEAYMRKLATGPAPVDRYLTGDLTALSVSAQRGMQVFVEAGCQNCHSGSVFSDQQFHNVGVPDLDPSQPDQGQAGGTPILVHNPFNLSGAFVDGSVQPMATSASPVSGGFRTPSLRNVALTAPYGHNGSFASLEDIVDFHLRGGGRGQQDFVGTVDDKLVAHELSSDDRAALLEFLKTLNGTYPALPWGQWPGGNG